MKFFYYLNNIKKISFMIMILFFLIILNSCNKKEDSEIKIGFSMGSLVLDRWGKDRDMLEKTIEENGGKFFVKYAHDNPTLQSKQIRQLVDSDMDVIIIIPDEKDSLVDALKYAKRKGVKIISYDRMITNSPVDLYISFNTMKVGELIARSILEKIDKGNLLIINGPKTDENSFAYNKGVKTVLQPYLDNGQINIAGEVWAKEWRETSSYDEINKLIEERIDFDGVIAGNDILAEGAITALIENNKLVPVVGQDADLAACQRIVEGTQYATVYKSFSALASFAGITSVNMAKNRQIYSNYTINNGKYEIPTYFINKEMDIINKDNIQQKIIVKEIYAHKDVYLKK